MRILHLAGDPRSRSGISGFAAELRTALRTAGIIVETQLVPDDALYTWREATAFADRARARAADFDLVQIELGGDAMHEFLAARLIAADGIARLFVTVHDPPWVVRSPFQARSTRNSRYLRPVPDIALGPLARRLAQGILQRARGVFTLSRCGLEALAAGVSDGLAGRGAVLPYAPPTRGIDVPRPIEARGDGLQVAFFGHWYAGKGLPTLVAALGLTAMDREPIRARLFGDGWPPGSRGNGARFQASIVSMIRDGPARDLIETPGFLAEQRLATELRRCDAVVLPYERRRATRRLASASAALLDAFSTGTPVVASRVRALEEFVQDGENGLLVAPDDPRDLARVLRRLRDDPELRDRLARGARDSAAIRSPEAAARVAIGLYRRRLNEAPAQPGAVA